MRRTLLAMALLLAVSACSSTPEQLGNPDVHTSIDAETDCAALQASFETAMGNVDSYEPGNDRRAVPLSYADHIADRQIALGC